MNPFSGLSLLLCYMVILSLPRSSAMIQRVFERGGFVIDSFYDGPFNDLDAWHGPGEGLHVEYGDDDARYLRLFPSDPDQNYNTQVSSSCFNMTKYKDMYLHVDYSGSDKFSISFNQNNQHCNSERAPYPDTADSVEASRYSSDGEIYVPLSHFSIDFSRALSIAFHGFYTTDDVTLYKVEIVRDVPDYVDLPKKLDTGTLVVKCKRPGSFAFGIDDGDPELAQEVMEILTDEGIQVTFFVVGNALRDRETNFTEVYREMLRRGHQVALHSYTHPKMEGLRTTEDMDDEIMGGYRALRDILGVKSQYFRPPYGTVGARTRQRLAHYFDDPYIVNWSIDIEDWIWADSDEPERQVQAFKRGLDRGGDLVVMHYLSRSTVQYFRQVIQMARDAGKRIMRVDQCMMDPDAPPLPDLDDEDEDGWDGWDADYDAFLRSSSS